MIRHLVVSIIFGVYESTGQQVNEVFEISRFRGFEFFEISGLLDVVG